MSWSGFKKNVGRATTQVMMKTGHVEKTSDRDYEVEERRYRTLESASLRLQKEAKGYLDSLRAMTASQMRIAETIDAFYGESGAKDGVSRSYKQAVEDLDAETVKALDGPYRCVTQDPEIRKLVVFDEYEGVFDYGVLEEIESELNFQAGNRRHYTQDMLEDAEGAMKLIEDVFRTTVLEPINRFCAYFPDINECIKKRNHKMLDYDSMRSKVKKLVEKPDKDPSKLPRTEKETEMVMNAQTFLHLDDSNISFPSPPRALDGLRRSHEQDESIRQPGQDADHPSDCRTKLQADEDAAMRSVGLGIQRKPSRLKRIGAASTRLASAFFNLDEDQVNSSPGTQSSHGSKSGSKRSSRLFSMQSVQESPTEARQQRAFSAKAAGATGMVPMVSPQAIYSPTFESNEKKKAKRGPEETPSRKSSMPWRARQLSSQRTSMTPSERYTVTSGRTSDDFSIMSGKTGKTWATITTAEDDEEDDRESIRTIRTSSQANIPPRTSNISDIPPRIGSIGDFPSRFGSISNSSSRIGSMDNFPPRTSRPSARTAFFHPSELEEIMGPLKEEFLEKQTNLLVQAKAAYDQLNEQLTDELPKLIDLRVPYLDPSFEALVKIQLRFCAEAYSRMAQVQQYLDASTRDQYANGDLDARVEDVLGQIRELSIAGTV